jgi:hypothetical protein
MPNPNDSKVPEKGEGNHAADQRYRDETKRFIDSGRVDEAAREAREAMDDESEADALEAAEAEGRSHAAGEDPEVSRR